MEEFFSFRKILTPGIIQIVFWIGVALCVITGLVGIFMGGTHALGGLMTIIIGPMIVRIYCALINLLFWIYDVLDDIQEQHESGLIIVFRQDKANNSQINRTDTTRLLKSA